MAIQLIDQLKRQHAARARLAELRRLDAQCLPTLIDEAQACTESDPRLARCYLELALTEARQKGEYPIIAKALVRLAWTSKVCGDLTAAHLQAHEAKLAANHVRDWTLDAGAQFVLATIESHVGNFDQAESIIQGLITTAQTRQDRAREADYFAELGFVRYARNHLRTAIGSLEYACNLYRDQKDAQLAFATNTLAAVHHELGNYQTAASLAEQAHAQALPAMLQVRAIAMDTFALAQIKLNQLDAARRALRVAEQYLRDTPQLQVCSLWVEFARAELAFAEGKATPAMQAMAALYKAAPNASRRFTTQLLTSLKSAHHASGDEAGAAKWAAELLRYNQTVSKRSARLRDALVRNMPRVNEMAARWAQVSQSRAVLIPM